MSTNISVDCNLKTEWQKRGQGWYFSSSFSSLALTGNVFSDKVKKMSESTFRNFQKSRVRKHI